MLLKFSVGFGSVLLVGWIGFSRWQGRPTYQVEKASPNGIYRVKIDLSETKATGTRGSNEQLKIQYFKKQEVVFTHQFENSEIRTVASGSPSLVEWVSDNTLHIGQRSQPQPFEDELWIVNDADETLCYLEIDYGKNNSFHVFDLQPQGQITLKAQPDFMPNGSSNYFLG